MRIIAGRYGKRIFAAPKGHRTHPMSEKARSALFNALGSIAGYTVLDAYAGSGALGFESLSRGARHATFVDNSKAAHKSVKETVELLGVADMTKVTCANISTWSDAHTEAHFQLVFADPPYHTIRPNVIEKLTRHVAPGGWLIVSYPKDEPAPKLSLPLEDHKLYGDATLLFYRRT